MSAFDRFDSAFTYETKASLSYRFENGFVKTCACPLCAQFLGYAPTRYKYHLALIVVVDKENYTHIVFQALLASERTEDFEFLFRAFREMIGGAQPQVSEVSMCSVHRETRGPQDILWLCFALSFILLCTDTA